MTIFKNLVHKNVCRTAQFWPQPRTLSLDTVGDVMAPSPLTIAPSMKVYEAVERVRQVGFSSPQMNTCYVVEKTAAPGASHCPGPGHGPGGQLIQRLS